MSNTGIDQAFKLQFSDTFRSYLEYQGSQLQKYVLNDTIDGQSKAYNYIGRVDLAPKLTSNSPTPYTDMEFTKRWIYTTAYDQGVPFDPTDLVRTDKGAAILAETARKLSNAVARIRDIVILNAITADVKAGNTSDITISLPSTQEISADATYKLSQGKLLEAKTLIDNASNDPNDPTYLIITPYQQESLLRQSQFTSGDYVSGKPSETGKLPQILGMNVIVIPTEMMTAKNGSGHRKCYVIKRSSICFVERAGRTMVEIDRLPTMSYSHQVYATTDVGAHRTLEESVVVIHSDESKI